ASRPCVGRKRHLVPFGGPAGKIPGFPNPGEICMRAAIVSLKGLLVSACFAASAAAAPPRTPEELRTVAQAYYDWRDENDPVATSDAGRHTWDDRLKDVSPAAIDARRHHVDEL